MYNLWQCWLGRIWSSKSLGSQYNHAIPSFFLQWHPDLKPIRNMCTSTPQRAEMTWQALPTWGMDLRFPVRYCLCVPFYQFPWCVFLLPTLQQYSVCCHITLGRDWGASDLQIHHAHKRLCSQWDVSQQSPGQTTVHASLHLWDLSSCHGEVSAKHS